MLAPLHPRTEERVAALARYDILDKEREAAFDDVVSLVARLCDTPIAVITLLDRDRQWFTAEVGLGVRSMPLADGICTHAVLEQDYLEIPDTAADPRTAGNPLCGGVDGLRFYAGVVLRTPDDVPLGTLCVLDRRPRTLSDLQKEGLRVLARQVMRELDLRLALARQEVLVGEIDHRVKNSLQSVSSIVRLQSSRTDNAEVRDALATVAQRVETVAAIHEQLHQASNGETVDLAALFARAGGLFAQVAPNQVSVTARFEPLTVNSADAHSVAIIANEFVANAIKHAFPPHRPSGAIRLTGEAVGEGYRIVCQDDGVGDADALAAMNDSRGLGSRLMQAAVGSLRGTAEWTTDGRGLTLTVDLPPR